MRFALAGLKQQLAGKAPDDLVFPSPKGTFLRVANLRRGYFDRAAASIGQSGLYPHELRHTAASLAITAVATVSPSSADARARLGDSDTRSVRPSLR